MREILSNIGIGFVILLAILGVIYIFSIIYRKIEDDNKYNIGFDGSLKKNGFPIMKLKIANEYKYFLLDTGCNVCFLKKKYFESIKDKINFESIGMGQLNSATSNEGNIEIIRTSLSYKKNKFNDEEFRIYDLDNLNAVNYNGQEVIGILGARFFNKYKWSFDFDENIVIFKKNV